MHPDDLVPDATEEPMPVPPVPATIRRRHRLTRRLDALPAGMLVEGPTGSGGTTLVASWARARERLGDRVVWASGQAPPLPSSAGRVVVVVDRGERLVEDEIRGLIAACAGRADTHLVVLARPSSAWTVPEIVDGAFGDRLSGVDLAATAAEVPDLARSWGHALDQAEIDGLVAASGGWLTGLQALLDTRGPDGRLDLDAACLRILTVGGLEPADPNAAYVGLRVCLVDRVDMAEARVACLAEGTMTETTLAATVDAMLRHGLLVPHQGPAGSGGWQLTGLMRNFARHGLDTDGALRIPLAARLARHRRADGRGAAEVATLARIGEDWALLSELWAGAGQHHDDGVLRAACTDLPGSVTAAWPVLAIAAAAVAGAPGAHPGVDIDIDALASVEEAVAVLTETAWHHALRGEHSTALQIVQRLDDEVTSRRRTGATEGTSARSTRLAAAASVYWLAGDEVSAAALLDEAYDAALDGGAERAVADVAGRALLLHIREGAAPEVLDQWAARVDPVRAPALAAAYDHRRALDDLAEDGAVDALHRWRAGPPPVGAWQLGLELEGAHRTVFGDPSDAIRLFDEGRGRPADDELGLVDRSVQRGVAEALLRLGEFHRLQAWLDQHRRRDGLLPPWLEVPAAWLVLRTDRPERARRSASAARMRRVSPRDVAELALVAAAAGDDQSDVGDVPLLAWSRLTVAELTASWRGQEVPKVLAARVAAEAAPVWIRLTPRERVVLAQLVEHDGAQAIASELTVSVNTVKKQLVSLYAKLGVHGRDDALLVARKLGLLDDR